MSYCDEVQRSEAECSGGRMPPYFRPGALRILRRVLPLLLAACADPATPSVQPGTHVERLEVVSGSGQQVWSGRRSVEPFVVRALAPGGAPAANATVRFSLYGGARGVLSQPVAATNDSGLAETYLMQASGRGAGRVVARADRDSVSFDLSVQRSPARIEFLPGSGAVGLPGFAHPDSIIEVVVTDTEGDVLPGAVVWFAATGELAAHNDTTDAQGRASTVLRRTTLEASEGAVFAFVLGFDPLARTTRPTASAAGRVVLISIDGLRADALERYQPPTLLRLAEEGAWARAAETVSPSLTVPAHLSLLAGVGPARHGVMSDNIRLTAEMAKLEPLFRRAGRNGRNTAAFLTDGGPLAAFRAALECRLAFGLDSLNISGSDGRAAATLAANALALGKLDLTFVHLPDPDVAGHAFGWDSEEYGRAVLRADADVALILKTLEGSAQPPLLIIASDHGGGGLFGRYLHGSDSPEDRLVPLILWGARVQRERLAGVSILDVAPTALWALGMAPPAHYEGKPLLEAFR